MSQLAEEPEVKDIVMQEETVRKPGRQGREGHELKSEYDTLTVPQTLWKFRKSISFAFIIGCTALADGYAGQING